MKKNVLQLTGSFHQGGSERQAVQLARLLHEDSAVNVFLATLNREGALLGEAEAIGIGEIHEFPLTSFYDPNFLRQVARLVRLLRSQRIDIVQTHDFYTNVFGMTAARLAGVKLRIASKRETGGMRSDAQKRVERMAFRQAHRIVANSAAVRDYLIDEGVSPEKLALIYNGLDLARLRPATDDRDAICETLGLPSGARFVTLVANLRHRVKNQAMFIRAAALVARSVPDAHFVIAGEGDLLNELEELTRALGLERTTHFIGRCTRVPDLLSISFAGALTSFNEGFSNSILEYMAAGLPVVATDVGGAREAIDDSKTGFLVESDDSDAFAERLIKLLRDEGLAKRLGSAGRKAVEVRFSCAAQVAKTLDLYGI